MLVLSRRPAQEIVFPSLGIKIRVARIQGNTVRLGVDAPAGVEVFRAELLEDPCHACQILARMNPRLTGKAHAGTADERRLLDVLGIEAELTGQLRVALQLLCRIAVIPQRFVEIAIDPVEVRIDPVLADDGIDLGYCRESSVPDGLRVIASELPHEFTETRIRDHRQMRGRVARVGGRTPAPLDQDDALTRLGQEIRGGQSRDAAPDDN